MAYDISHLYDGANLNYSNDVEKVVSNAPSVQQGLEQQQAMTQYFSNSQSKIKSAIDSAYLFSDKELQLISNQMEKSDEPDSIPERYRISKFYSSAYNLPLDYVVSNLDDIVKSDLGEAPASYSSGNFFEAITDSWERGTLSRDFNNLANKLVTADRLGQDTSEIERALGEYQEAINNRQDTKKRNWFVDLAKLTAEVAPDTIIPMAKTLVPTLALSTITGGTSLAPALAKLIGIGATAFLGADSYKQVRGANYYDLTRNKGVDPAIAREMSSIDGAIQAAIEVGIAGIGGKAISMFTGGATTNIASKIALKMIAGGKMGAMASYLTNVITDSAGEGLEEFLQYGVEYLTNAFALEASGVIQTDDDRYSISQAFDNTLKGFLGSLVFSVLGGVEGVKFSYENMQTVNGAASLSGDLSSFRKNVEKLKPEGVTEEHWAQYTKNVWDKLSPNGAEYQNKNNVKFDRNAEPVEARNVNRLSNKKLFTADERRSEKNEQGVEEHTYYLGDPKASTDEQGYTSKYGSLDYEIDNKGNVEITSMSVGNLKDNIVKDFVKQFISEHPTSNIEWNTEGSERLGKIKDSLMIDGKLQYNKSYSNRTEIQRAKSYISSSENFAKNLDNEQMEVASVLFAMSANSRNLTVDQFADRYLEKNGFSDFTAEEEKAILEGKGLSAEHGDGVKGVTMVVPTVSEDGLIRATRRLISVGSKGDFSTFTHEFFHVVDTTMDNTQRKNMYDTISARWNDKTLVDYISAHGELFAQKHLSIDAINNAIKLYTEKGEYSETLLELGAGLWEGYLKDGKTNNEKLNSLFSVMKGWLKSIYNALKGTKNLSDDIINNFDAILANDKALSSEAINTADNLSEGVDTLLQIDNDKYTELDKQREQELDRLKTISNTETPLTKATGTYKVGNTWKTGSGFYAFYAKDPSPDNFQNYRHSFDLVFYPDGTTVDTYEGMRNKQLLIVPYSTKQPPTIFIPEGYDPKYMPKETFMEDIKKLPNIDARRTSNLAKINEQITQDKATLGESIDRLAFVATSERKDKERLPYPFDIEDKSIPITDELKKGAFYLTDEALEQSQSEFAKKQLQIRDDLKKTPQLEEALASADTLEDFLTSVEELKTLSLINQKIENAKDNVDFDAEINSIDEEGVISYDNEYQLTEEEKAYYKTVWQASAFMPRFAVERFKNTYSTVEKIKEVMPDFVVVRDVYKDHNSNRGHYDNTFISVKGIPKRFKDLKVAHNDNFYSDVLNDLQNNPLPYMEAKAIHDGIASEKNSDRPINADTINRDVMQATRSMEFQQSEKQNVERLLNKEKKPRAKVVPQGATEVEVATQNLRDNIIISNEVSDMAIKAESEEEFVREFVYNNKPNGYLATVEEINNARDVYAVALTTPRVYAEKWAENNSEYADIQRITALTKNNEALPKGALDLSKLGGLDQVFEELADNPLPYAIVDLQQKYNDLIKQDANSAEAVETKALLDQLISDNERLYNTEEVTAPVTTSKEVNPKFKYGKDTVEAIEKGEEVVAKPTDFSRTVSPDTEKLQAQREDIANAQMDEDLKTSMQEGSIKAVNSQAEKTVTDIDNAVEEVKKEIETVKALDTNKKSGEAVEAVKKSAKELGDTKVDMTKDQLKELEAQKIKQGIEKERKRQVKKIKKLKDNYKDKLKFQKAVLKQDANTRVRNLRNLFNDEIAKIYKEQRQDAKDTKVATRILLKELETRLKRLQKEKAQAQQVVDYTNSLIDYINKPLSMNIDYAYRGMIKDLIEASGFDANFKSGKISLDVTENGKTSRKYLTPAEAVAIMEANGVEKYEAKKVARAYELLNKTAAKDFTLLELEDLVSQIASLKRIGIQVRQNKIAIKQENAEIIKDRIKDTLIASGKTLSTANPVSDESKEKSRNGKKYRGAILSTFNIEHIARILDNGKDGVFQDILVNRKRDAQNEKWGNIQRRIDKVSNYISQYKNEKGDTYTLADMQRRVYDEATKEHYSVSELAYALLASRNEQNYNAYVYGKLVSISDKVRIEEDAKALFDDVNTQEAKEYIRQSIIELGTERYNYITKLANDNLSEADLACMEALSLDMREQIDRINKVSIAEDNYAIDEVKGYLPIFRIGGDGIYEEEASGVAYLEKLVQANASLDTNTMTESGFRKERLNIKAEHQGSINSDLLSVWDKSIDLVEQYISFTPLAKQWNRIFRTTTASDTRHAIVARYGDAYTKYLGDYMNEVINPQPFYDSSSAIVRLLRGNLPAAYLGFKTSSVILQLITSPTPFLKEINPIALASAYIKTATSFKESEQFVFDHSNFMRNRTLPTLEVLKHDASFTRKNTFGKKFSQVQEFGMQGLEFADHISVYAGWIACYDKKIKELGGMETTENQAIASHYADSVVHNTQPLSDATEIAPLFKRNEAMKVLTQFTVSMNTIWNNITVDSWALGKQAFNKTLSAEERAQASKQLVGMIAGYMLAGVTLGLVRNGLKGDDDEPEKVPQKLLAYSLSQMTSSVPLVNSQVENLFNRIITGEGSGIYSTSNYPAIDYALRGINALTGDEVTNEDVKRSITNLTMSFGLTLGLPTSAIREGADIVKQKSPAPLIGR